MLPPTVSFGCSLEHDHSRLKPHLCPFLQLLFAFIQCYRKILSYFLDEGDRGRKWAQLQNLLQKRRETYNWGKQWCCCIKHRKMSQSYRKARDTNSTCSCTMPFHPAASAHSRSWVVWVLPAGLRPSKLAVRTWRIDRRSLRCRWTPTEPNLLSRGKRGKGLLILCYSKTQSSLWSCAPNW